MKILRVLFPSYFILKNLDEHTPTEDRYVQPDVLIEVRFLLERFFETADVSYAKRAKEKINSEIARSNALIAASRKNA